MKIMANDNITLNKNESIQIFFEDHSNILQVSGDSKVLWIQDKDSKKLQKGRYPMTLEK